MKKDNTSWGDAQLIKDIFIHHKFLCLMDMQASMVGLSIIQGEKGGQLWRSKSSTQVGRTVDRKRYSKDLIGFQRDVRIKLLVLFYLEVSIWCHNLQVNKMWEEIRLCIFDSLLSALLHSPLILNISVWDKLHIGNRCWRWCILN